MDYKRQKIKKGKTAVVCPICGVKQISTSSYLKNYVTCSNCSGHFIEDNVEVDYPETYFKHSGESMISRILDVFLWMRISFIRRVVPKGKILDYGSGPGKLVAALNKNGYVAVGFEPSDGARKIAKEQNLPVFKNIKRTKNGYDLIMFWQSLEHIKNPLKTIKDVKKYLAKDGKILIAVPNSDSFNAKFGGERWFHLTYPMHKVHFNPRSIRTMLAISGFEMRPIDYFNPEYTLSGLVQTLLNFILPKDVLYSLVAHRRRQMNASAVFLYGAISLLLIFLFSPFIIMLYLVELIFRKTDAILITACKSTRSAAFVDRPN